MTVEISVALLVFFLTIILAVYNQRQASALRGMERLVQDFVAMQIRDRRTRHIEGLAERIDPLEWLAHQASSELDTPITISEVIRVVHEIQAVELRATSGLRVIASTSPRSDVMRGVQVIERIMSQANEFFDIEADAVSERLGLKWEKPSRLWFYVVK